MTKPYSLAFKQNVVKEYRKVLAEGTLSVKGIEVNTINEFIKVFGITKYSLYSWAGKFDIGDGDQDYGENNEVDLDFEIELPGEKKESEIVENNIENPILMETSILSKMMKDIGFWQSLARALEMKNYRQSTVQLKLRIGNHLINGTGLAESNKEVRKELRIELADNDDRGI